MNRKGLLQLLAGAVDEVGSDLVAPDPSVATMFSTA